MISFTGNTSDAFTSQRKNLPFILENFSVVNKTNSNVYVNVYKVINLNSLYSIMPLNTELQQGEMYEGTRQICILASEQIRLETTGTVDYDFTLKNMKFD